MEKGQFAQIKTFTIYISIFSVRITNFTIRNVGFMIGIKNFTIHLLRKESSGK